ncbi:protein LAZ1 [Tanacetum coccineum]
MNRILSSTPPINGQFVLRILGNSNILTYRIIEGIKEVVSDNQLPFVPGRRISDNILITQELMHNYHMDRGPPRCAFKVDIQKASDTVDWRFLEHILKCFGKQGLRQGDPLSSYFFTLVMEILTLILQRRVRESDIFRYHKNCKDLNIINVCFADDPFLFARGDVDSAKVIMDSLNEFKDVSGLVPSIPKTATFFCNVLNHVKIGILNIMPFSEGKLLVKYLGVPLISSSLLNKDCKILVEKARNRIEDLKKNGYPLRVDFNHASQLFLRCKCIGLPFLLFPKVLFVIFNSLFVVFFGVMANTREGKLKSHGKIFSSQSTKEVLVFATLSPISRFLTPRDIAREGFTLQTNVTDLVENGVWTWPLSCLAKAPNLGLIIVPNLDDSQDCVQWWDHNVNMAGFSVKLA